MDVCFGLAIQELNNTSGYFRYEVQHARIQTLKGAVVEAREEYNPAQNPRPYIRVELPCYSLQGQDYLSSKTDWQEAETLAPGKKVDLPVGRSLLGGENSVEQTPRQEFLKDERALSRSARDGSCL